MPMNNWDESAVQRAINRWGDKYPDYLLCAYQYACGHGKNYLDIGCGFGRFLNYLMWHKKEDYDYIGYDSSEVMLEKIKEKIDSIDHATVYSKDITQPFAHIADFIMCNAVLIHLSPDDQVKVLRNIASAKPKHAVFDFNIENRKNNIEKTSQLAGQSFRMTWNSKAWCLSQVKRIFKGASIEMKSYRLKGNKYKIFFYITLAIDIRMGGTTST